MINKKEKRLTDIINVERRNEQMITVDRRDVETRSQGLESFDRGSVDVR